MYQHFRNLSQQYVKAITKVKWKYWNEWLEGLSTNNAFLANRYTTDPLSDYSCFHIPPLKYTIKGQAASALASINMQKSEILVQTFFPSYPSELQIPSCAYLKLLKSVCFFICQQIWHMIKGLSSFKVSGPDGISNVVLIHSLDHTIDYLYYIYRAALEHKFYHDQWWISTTLVLCKSGYPAYNIAKSYHLIGFLSTIGKVLSMLTTNNLLYLVKKHQLLPVHQFEG